MLEREIEKRVKTYAESKGWMTRKWSSPSHAFVPDQIFFSPDGRIRFVEFKREDGFCTPGQIREHEKLRKQNCTVWVINSVELGKKLIDEASN